MAEIMDQPVEIIPGALDAGVLFICDHAANAVPAELGDLGLTIDDTRMEVYGMDYNAWKQLHQRDASPDQQKAFAAVMSDATKHG